jgi:hypothetical protein
MPESNAKIIWNLIMIILLIYTATFVPFRTAFIDEVSPLFEMFEYSVDALFFIDLFVNFLSAYVNEDKNMEIRVKVIAMNYIQSWFFFDLFACIPF